MSRPKTLVLVVDTNKVFAKAVKEILETNLINAKAHVATNVWEIKRRISKYKYDLVLADLSVTLDSEDIMKEFRDEDVTVIQWSALNVSSDNNLLYKPNDVKQLESLVRELPLA